MHEAAALDGADWWPKLRYVVLPYLRGPVALACLLATLHHINNFTLPFVLFGVPAPHDVEVLPVLTYVESFQNFRFGLSAPRWRSCRCCSSSSRCSSTCGRSGSTSTRREASDGHRDCHRPTGPPRDGQGPRRAERGPRLLPPPLLVTVTTVLCLMVLVPVAYIVLASINSDLSGSRR